METDAVKYFPILLLIKEKTVNDKGIKRCCFKLIFHLFLLS